MDELTEAEREVVKDLLKEFYIELRNIVVVKENIIKYRKELEEELANLGEVTLEDEERKRLRTMELNGYIERLKLLDEYIEKMLKVY